MMRRAWAGLLGVGILVGLGACDKKDEPRSAPPPPPPTPSASTKVDACQGGGGQVKDTVSGGWFPRAAAGFCIDPQGAEKTYGEGGKYSMDEVCTTAFDGECEVYKRFGLHRVVSLRYIDGSGKPSSVEVILSTFADAAGAYAMFTKRVVAEGDPLGASVKPLAAGTEGAIGRSNAYVWKGPYLAEITFVTEDAKATPDQIAKMSQDASGAIAKELGSKLPGDAAKLPAASALPSANLIPLGVLMIPKDPFGITGAGPAALGYYKDGEKRWRILSVVRPDADQAKDTFKAIRSRPGAAAIKDLGDEAVTVSVADGEGKDAPKLELLFARKGSTILAVSDEPHVLKGVAADKQAALRLTKDDARALLRTVLAAAAPPAPAPSAAPKK